MTARFARWEAIAIVGLSALTIAINLVTFGILIGMGRA